MTVLAGVAMDGYYMQDRLQEIWQQIGSLHLSYLEMEESPQKLEQRNKLEVFRIYNYAVQQLSLRATGYQDIIKLDAFCVHYNVREAIPTKANEWHRFEYCIKEFLCLAPHNQKFVFRETADVLHRSASTKKDFSGYRAALGFNAIGMYAANLLNQPWRKEYKQILLYSGFYKHQIDAHLVGAEVIFEAMGYKHDGDGILTLDGPICPDRVISISQDSLIAYVECQILKSIWEEVSTNFKVSWLEVLEFRETHLCSPKQSVQALNYRFHERQFQQHTRSYSQGTDPFSGVRYSYHSTPLSANHSFPPLHSHASVGSIPLAPQCIYGTNGYYPNNYATYAPVAPQHFPYHVPLTYAQPVVKPVYHSNYYPNGYTVPPPPPSYACPAIPTAQLIEVESQSSHHYDSVDGHSQPVKVRGPEVYSIKNDLKSSSDKEEVNSETIDSWDYVYRNLESQGYSKDLGERGDLLSPPLDKNSKVNVKEAKKVKSAGLEDAMNMLGLNEKAKTNEVYQRLKERRSSDVSKPNERDYKQSVSESSLKKQATRQIVNGFKSNNTLPPPEKINKIEAPSSKPSHSKTLDIKKLKQSQETNHIKIKEKEKSKELVTTDPGRWQCGTCTFLNRSNQDICEMCGKSKVKVQDVMEIGGSQCPRCTLVNPKDNKICDACSGSLKDSPTYI